jgi:uncharacterized protein
VIVDANVLLFAEDDTSAHHDPCRAWLEAALSGPVRIGLPWPSLLAFLRIRTNPRVYRAPLSIKNAWDVARAWLGAPSAWVPVPTERHAEVLGRLLGAHTPTANLLPDAHLAALAVEHGVGVCSVDTDFARFPELRWTNPLTG